MQNPSPDQHLLTVSNIERSIGFYTEVVGMRERRRDNDRAKLSYGKHIVELREQNESSKEDATDLPTVDTEIQVNSSKSPKNWIKHFAKKKVPVLQDPDQDNTRSKKTPTICIHDPDGNVIKITTSNCVKARVAKCAALLTIVCTLGVGSFVWRTGGELACPPRLAISEAGQAILEAPETHGVHIRKGLALNGKIPYLIVEPILKAKPGERGAILRKQLSEKGVALHEFGSVEGTVVLLHGRMARKENFLAVAVRFCAAGFRCIIPDLPAHGESPMKNVAFGSSEFESSIPENLHRELLTTGQIGSEPASLWGMSMGGAFATSAASRNPGYWRSLVVVSSFDNLKTLVAEKANHLAGPTAPALAFLVEQCAMIRGGVPLQTIQPSTWAESVTTPTLVFHGEDDDLISIDRGHTLYKSYTSSDKSWIPVSGGGHSNVLITPAPTYRMMTEWMIAKNRAYPVR